VSNEDIDDINSQRVLLYLI